MKEFEGLLKTKGYNSNDMIRVKPGHCMENKPIKAYEPCQIRKEAAISRYFCVELFSIE